MSRAAGNAPVLAARGKSHPGCERVFERTSASFKLPLSPDKAASSLLDLPSNPSPSPAQHFHHGLPCRRLAVLVAVGVWALLIAGTAVAQEAPPPDAALDLRALESEMYQLSFIEVGLCIDILKSMGYTTGAPEGPLPMSKLPLILPIGDTATDSVVGATDQLNPTTDSSPQNRLMILYHLSQIRQLARLRRLIAEKIDIPSRQVLIEALLLELSESGIRELGLEYEWVNDRRFKASFLTDGDETPFILEASRFFAAAVDDPRKLSVVLKAIIDEQKGEILSSPTILALDGRQARIRIGQDVPILTTIVTQQTESLNIRYEKVGITLNIKPRISRDGTWVTLQIQVEVSEAPPEDFIEVKGQRVAPVINRRKVETIATIRNNTPFIIGGLIRNSKGGTVRRIPIISAIPIIGNLFKIRTNRDEKREVIIVITPRVIETAGANRPVLPKDDPRLDFLDARLFRHSYRLKAEDVFDLGFITENAAIQATFRRAREFLETHPEYRGRPPFDAIRGGGVPGEESIVVRMIYEITKGLHLHETVVPEKMILFTPAPDEPAGFKVTELPEVLAKVAGDMGTDAWLDSDFPKDVLILHYRLRRDGADVDKQDAAVAPVASIRIEHIESREEAEAKILAYGRIKHYYRTEAAILIAGRKDIQRLAAAVAMREVLKVNNLEDMLMLKNFRVGRRIVIPELDPSGERNFLIDDAVADLYFQSDFYYEAFQDKFRNYYNGIREILQQQGD